MTKVWVVSAVGIVLGITTISFFNATMAVDAVRSFINGESNIGFWMKHGWSWRASIIIAVACSTYDIFAWFTLFNALKGLYQKAKPLYDALVAGHRIELLDRKAAWVRHISRVGLRIYLFCVPQPKPDLVIMEGFRPGAKQYLWLLFYGFMPSCIWSGVGYSFSFRLNRFIAFVIIATANAVKMIAFGGLTLLMGPWAVVIGVTAIPIIRWFIERSARDENISVVPDPGDPLFL